MHDTELGGFSARPEESAPAAPQPFSLTPAQLGVWYAQLLDPDVPINVAQYVDVPGELDPVILREVSIVAAREYESVLVRLGESGGAPTQCVDPAGSVDIQAIDLRESADPVAAAHEWMRAEASAPVDMLTDRLFAGAVLRVADRRSFWYLRAHHLVLDGFGALTSIQRVAELYTARVLGTAPPAVQPGALRALVDGELAYRDSARFATDRAHWAERVAGLDGATSLDGRTAPRSATNLLASRVLPDTLVNRMNTLAASQDSTLAVVLLAAFAGYLGRLTDRDEVVLSLPVTARTTAVLRRSAGMLSNIVPLRLAVDRTWGELLRATRVEVAGALRHQRYRHEDIRRDAGHNGGSARRALFGPLANIMLFGSELTLGTRVGRYHVLSTGPVADLSLNVYYGERDSVHVDFEANPNLYAADDIARHHDRFLRYLERLVAADIAAPMTSVAVATELELEVSTRIWNTTAYDVSAVVAGAPTLVSMFEAQVARTPDAVAVRFAGALDLTYRELAARSNRLARHLIGLGVGPETLIAVNIRRSPELVVAIYAILAAGAAYVPLDPDHPAERTAHILATAAPVCVLSTEAVPGLAGSAVIRLDELDDTACSDGPVWDLERTAALRPGQPAYVIFTSGSTGLPKGVAVTHEAIVNRLVWMQRMYRLSADDVVLQKTPATFDVSVWEFFWPLQVGAQLVLAEPDGHRDPAYLRAVIAEYGVTTAHFVPSMLDAFLAEQECTDRTSLRTVFASGEALPAALAQRTRVLTGARLHNLYGPTEAAVDVTFHEVTDTDTLSVPIGAPVFNTRLYVLDSRLRPVPVGAAGELYLSGVQLARGYIGRPGLSADRFVADPFGGPHAPGGRMYRTGDLVRWTTHGELAYLGRTDFQVKLRGLRIELGEIEAVLGADDAVVRAVVVVRDEAGVGEQLVAYVVESEPGTVQTVRLRAAAIRALPAYMVPAAFVVLDALPVNASGKLDRAALPAPERTALAYTAAETPLQAAVARVFEEVLGHDRVGRDDDFFALGGNSLVATQVAARLGADLGCRLGVRELFTATTVSALAELIERAGGASGEPVFAQLRARYRPPLVPLSPAQQRIWFLNRFDSAGAGYNMPFVVRLRGGVDLAALRSALIDLVARHEVLRTIFPAVVPSAAAGIAAKQVVLSIDELVVVGAPESINTDELDEELARFAAGGFDLEREIPIRARIFLVDDDSCALGLVLHHIAADGLSLRVLARDVMAAYGSRRVGNAPDWRPLAVQYADYSLWQHELLGSATDPAAPLAGQLAFWTAALAGAPDLIELPADRSRPAVSSGQGATFRFELPGDVHAGIAQLARAQGVSNFMVLHAALAVLLSRLSGSDDIVIGTPVAGRGERALDDLVGMFVNTLVLRTEIDTAAPFSALLAQVRETDLGAFGHAELPFEQLVDAINPPRSQARHPLFQVLLAFDNAADIRFELPDLSVDTSTLDTGVTKFDLQLTVTESFAGAGLREGPAPAKLASSGVGAEFTYATDLFDESTIAEYAQWLVRLLQAIVVDVELPIGDLPLLDTAGRQRVLDCGMGASPVGSATTLLAAFEVQARRTPDAVALVDGDGALTYAELAGQVNRLARLLIAAGVGPEALVVLGMRRSVQFVVAAYAVLTAGGGYVPVDPDQPPARQAHVIASSRPVCVLTRSVDGWSGGDARVPVLVVDALDCTGYSAARVADSDRVCPLRTDNTAYVIFTSGSTGRPKGVAVPHASVVNQIEWIADEYGIGPADAVLFKTPATFDVSVWELFAPLARGARLVVADHDGHRDSVYLAATIAAYRVTMMSFVPSMLVMFAEVTGVAQIASLRTVFVAGEAMTGAAATAFATVSRAELHNLYGPTEFTVHATYAAVDAVAGGPVPIGRPVRASQALVLDARLRPVPDLVIGELYLSGVQVARGYHGRADSSAERFVANPYGPAGARMYRTGDLVRRNRAGDLEYLGRSDFQVKLRGQRIELGEIEAALVAAPDVRAAAVRVFSRAAGELLVAYVVTSIPAAEVAAVLEQRLRAALPSYMVPSAYVALADMPLTSSGKLDRKALPDPVLAARTFRAPVTTAEHAVAGVFAAVLGLDRVGLDDDFFALGGNSLVATQIAARLGAVVGVDIPVRLLFEYSTVAAFAAQLPTQGAVRNRRALVAGPRPDVVPLSYAQQRMWFLNQFDADSVANNLTAAMLMRGALDVVALNAAVTDVLARHETLRTRYPAVDGIAHQQVLSIEEVARPLVPESVVVAELADRIRAVAAMPFAVDREPPVRLTLLCTGSDDGPGAPEELEHVLVVSIHHISADGWSIAPLTRDLMAAYAARRAGHEPGWAPLPVQYADYTRWQRETLGAEDDPESLIAEQIRYWAAELAGVPDVLTLPADRPRPAIATGRGARHVFIIDAATHRRLRGVAAAANASLFMVLHAALATLLAKLAGQQDIAIGTPIAGRGDQALDELVGMFVNTLVLRTELPAELSFADLLSGVRDADLRAFAHADVPFERLVEVLRPERSAARHPLFQVMLDFQNTGRTSLELAGLAVSALDIDTRTAEFDLQLTLAESVDVAGMVATFEYATDLFDAATVVSFATRLRRVLEAIVDPRVRIGDIDLLSADERTQILHSWNATARPTAADATLVSLFEEQVARTPAAVAISFDGESLTYAKFAGRVNRLARLLVSIGVRPDTTVAIGMRRSIDLVVATYAVLTAGGAYVPVDPDHPAGRIGQVLRTARPVCVLTRTDDGLELAAEVEEAVLDVDLFDTTDYSDAPLTDDDRFGALLPGSAAYVIFTSGSTGRPKGVAVSHAAIVNRLVWMQDAYALTADDVVLQKTPATFDVSVWEFFWPLQVGARLVVAQPDGHRDPAYLAAVICRERVSVVHFVPSMLVVFVAEPVAAQCDSLRLVFASGEALPPRPVHRLRELTGAAVHNLYGPTEAAVDVTSHEVTHADVDTVPIGGPVFNTQVYVLDGRLRPVPAGVPGELYLAGTQLARGYVARSDLTSDRFVANPFGTGARMYRTGDLVSWRADGVLEYLGRTDFQVKLRGLRIELGDIETALAAVESIAQAVVVLRDASQLVAYVVAEPGTVDTDAVKSMLSRQLPAYMVPSAYVVLDEFPLNGSGKLDRKALPAPVFEAAVFRPPVTGVQEIVARTFAEVLDVERVGLDDDFFALGGNSLNATQVLARLGAALDLRLPVRLLFEASTVEALAAATEVHQDGRHIALTARPRPERIPLSPAQRRMWFLNRYLSSDESGPGDAVGNIPVALRLTGDLDVEALAVALADVVARHESLRTVYPDGPDGARQVILPVAVPILESEQVTEGALAQRLTAFAAATFDLTSESPLRARLYAVAGVAEHVLAIVLHHISADGCSLGPLAGDLLTAYAARRDGAEPAWAALPVQYADYTLWQAETLGDDDDPESPAHRQLAYWQRTLAGLPEQLELPTDRPRPAVSSYRGATHRLRIDSDLHSELRELARKRETTLFSTVHAALAVLLSRLSVGADIAIGTPVAGRGDAALDRLVGMFVNTVVLRTRIDTRARFETVLDTVRVQDIEALSHADVPFERLVEVMAPTRAQHRHPLFQVALTFQNFTLPRLELADLVVRPIEFDAVAAKFDLQFTVVESDDADGRADGVDIEITYATDLFDAGTIAVLGRRFTQVLAAIAADATVVVGDIQLLSAEEQHRALHEWAASTRTHVTETSTLADRFARAAAIDPTATAVRAGTESLTYAELDAGSNRLARRLIAAGVGPEALVAVALPRSVQLIVALLAVIKAGGGYLPLDPNYPADRIEYMLDDARPICAITSAVAGLPPGWFGGPVLDVDTVAPHSIDPGPITQTDRRAPLNPAHPAYVIYTSGSTGKPKGVVIPHRNVLRLLDNTKGHFDFGPSDVWTMFHSYAFDFSVWELWGALLHGGKLVVVDYYTARSPQQFLELLAAEKVTVLNQTPSAFYQLIAVESSAELALRYVIFGGEALEPQRLSGWFARSPRLVNMYGITETTVHVSHRAIESGSGSASVIGSAIPGLVMRLLDARLRPVPVGVPGEIYVSGGQLARGYLGRPALTASRFVADPYAEGGSLAYRSGDLARWTTDGELEYLGRADQQVNLRGFRIELGEIEAALLEESAAVREVAVVVRTDSVDEPRIIAYAVGHDTIDTAALRQRLARRLPEHMVPATIVVVDRIPLTVNGKLDRAALPAPAFEVATYHKPGTVAEEIVAGVFAEVLGRTDDPGLVGADDDFFALGGSSLSAAKAAARIGAAFGRTVGVRALFEAPRVADLAALVVADDSRASRPALVAGARPARIPLSPAQQRMWFLNRFDQHSIAYNIPVALRLTGTLDIAALQAAVADLIGRHESLRTRYPELDGVAAQMIVPVVRAVPSLYLIESTEAELPERIRELAATTFDVTVDIPVRMRLFRIAGRDEFVLAAVLHHIAADGSSLAPFVRDLILAYTARLDHSAPGWPPPAVQYADYALWQRELLGGEKDPGSLSAQQIAYWTRTLAGLPDQLTLPADHPRPARQSLRGAKVEFAIEARLHAAFIALGRHSGATLFMVVHAAFAVLLSRLSGSADIAVGTPIAGRGDAELDDVIGMFVNTLVLRTRVDGADSFAELLGQARAVDIAAFSHADVPFERLVEVLNPQRSTARHPLFQVGYSFQNHERGVLRLPGLEVSELEFDSGVAQFDLHLFAVDHYGVNGAPAGIDMALGYATDLFESASAQRFAGQLARVLEAVVAQPDTAVGDLDLLGEAVRTQVLEEWNRTTHPVAPVTLADLIDTQVALTPRSIALIDANSEAALTYAEFDAAVNRLARRLIADGVGPEATVVLAMRRSVELVVAMYAVVRAGGAYVPIDPDHPADRIAHIIETAAPVCVLTTSRDGLPIEISLPTREVDSLDLTEYAPTPIVDAERVRPLRPQHPAYVIFTSGSTGLPKGVTIAHAAIVNQLAWLRDRFAPGPHASALLKTPATFDLSVWEFWSILTTGGRLVVTAPGTERDPDRLRALIERHAVTVLHAVPALVGMLLAVSDAPLPGSLRHVLAIGEALAPTTALEFRRRAEQTGARLFNLYGPTEAAVSITAFEVDDDPGHVVPIGVPAWNSRVYVLDARLRPVPVGVSGELYLAGAQLARGYQRRSGMTAERFVADPFATGVGTVMYRTGDIVGWRPDGTLEYLERADFQVKIGGFRIELGEVETALLRLPDVRAAVAVARDDDHTGSRLIAYVAATIRVELASELRAAVAAELPTYMVPAAIVVLESLPLNANGKVDRSALPEPVLTAAAFRAPNSELEQLVADTFAAVIGTAVLKSGARVGLDTDFFAIGGNSLLATRVVAQLGSALGVRVPVAAVFDAPTVGLLAAHLAELDDADDRPALTRRLGAAPAALSLAQQRMWVVNRLSPDSAAYNIPAALRLTGDLDVAALGAAILDVLERHETLRTRYPDAEPEPVQEVVPLADMAVPLEPMLSTQGDIDARINEFVSAGFDITTAPPVRAALVRTGVDEHVLVVVLHHISADGYSVAPMTRDLMRAYLARTSGHAPDWAPLEINYADYSEWQRAVLGSDRDPNSLLSRQLRYWTTELAELPEVLPLPMDRPRPARRDMRGAAVDFEVDAVLSGRLDSIARAHGTTLFTLIHSAFAVLLAKLSGTTDIAIGAPVAGRGERELDDLIGMFVNTVVLRTEVDARTGFADLLRQARDRDIAALSHADVPFDRVVDVMGRTRSNAYTALFQVMFTFQNMPSGRVALPGLEVEVLDLAPAEAKYDLQLTGIELSDAAGEPAGLAMRFGYATDIFDAGTVQLFAERLLRMFVVIAQDPSIAIRAIDIRDPEQVRGVTVAELPTLIAAAARIAPGAVAFTHDAHAVTYGELAAKLATVAKAMGAAAKPETLINVALAGLVPGLLAALGGTGLAAVLRTLLAEAQAVLANSGSAVDSEGIS
ncbi:non-ribosomal peptide synthase/polyketide synthase [Nocardia sp. NBC_00565]|uniref:non-ribosomal peptide synthase/polyketide synthase n=1 Tax=Nocardia sp. NBC_00565 TaxID=2975993 RepID=UPI002E808B52|nr:non-ribosomal peptide synthase/polyketide synthase [Nocardia sp. NBC_00565]WUC01121.1 non-ribosomal peptide synthase/polyketide synthase [Nocardia sp. NBC_00565]